MKHILLLAALALLPLASCASKKTPMVRTTTTSTLAQGDIGEGEAVKTVIETPFESELDKGFGRAADNLFAQP